MSNRSKLLVEIDGIEYALSTTLRVAYKVQGQHNHKPYSEVFAGLGDMTLEQQINVLYAAFQCANPQASKTITAQKFLDHYLDNYNLKYVMEQMNAVVEGITGKYTEGGDEDVTGDVAVDIEYEGN